MPTGKTVKVSGLELSASEDQYLNILKAQLKFRGLISTSDKRDVIKFLIASSKSQKLFTDDLLDKLQQEKK